MTRTRVVSEIDEARGVRFGRTVIVPVTGGALEQGVEAIVCPANRRGVMGAGFAGQIRLAGGGEIEREAMANAPLTIGSAIGTGAGSLTAQGITTIVHAVVSDALGAPTRLDIVRSATGAALRVADRARVRSILMPTLGTGLGPGRLPSGTAVVGMIEEIVAYLRRFTSRLDTILLLQFDEREAMEVRQALIEARDMWWSLRVPDDRP